MDIVQRRKDENNEKSETNFSYVNGYGNGFRDGLRKYYGEAIVVTQEVEDIISSPVVKEAIINNSDCKILLDQRTVSYTHLDVYKRQA